MSHPDAALPLTLALSPKGRGDLSRFPASST